MKIEKNQNPSIFLATYWNLSLKKSGDLEAIFSLNLTNLGHFFSMETPLYRSKSYFSSRNLAKFSPKQKALG
jgi:hypothetical protein